MKQLILALALTGLMIGIAGSVFAQQQQVQGGPPELQTCSQMATFCNSSCESVTGPRHRECQAGCQTRRAECMASGMWKNISTGQLIPKRKE